MSKAVQDVPSIGQITRSLNEGKTTVKAIVEYYLKAIEELNPDINAITAVSERALGDADKLDVRSSPRNRSLLSQIISLNEANIHPRNSTRVNVAHCSASQ